MAGVDAGVQDADADRVRGLLARVGARRRRVDHLHVPLPGRERVGALAAVTLAVRAARAPGVLLDPVALDLGRVVRGVPDDAVGGGSDDGRAPRDVARERGPAGADGRDADVGVLAHDPAAGVGDRRASGLAAGPVLVQHHVLAARPCGRSVCTRGDAPQGARGERSEQHSAHVSLRKSGGQTTPAVPAVGRGPYTGELGRARPSARSPNPGAMIAPGWAISSSATIASVVSSSAATDAAWSSARRVTRTGSTTPLSTRSPNSPVKAFRPWPSGAARTWSIVAWPS